MSRFHHIADLAFNRPLLLLPSAAEMASMVLLDRMRGIETPPQADRDMREMGRLNGQPVRGAGRQPMYVQHGANAVITVEGKLVNRGAWIGADSGMTSYEGVSSQLQAAARDPSVQTIVLDLESPGGEAVGAMEIAALVRKISSEKRVVAVVDGMAASAGYAMASGASEIITIPTGIVGSIGVVMLHIDQSAALADKGFKPTLIFAGAHKVDGHPFAALPKDVRANFQAEIDGFYDLFVETVVAGRKNLDAAAVRGTEARTYIGADAVKVGLADAVGTLDDVLAELASSGGKATFRKATSMTIENPTPAAALDTGPIVAATKARIGAILNSDEGKANASLASHLAFATEMSVDDAKATLRAAGPGAAPVAAAAPAAPAAAAPAAPVAAVAPAAPVAEVNWADRKASSGALGMDLAAIDDGVKKADHSAGWAKASQQSNRSRGVPAATNN